MTWDTWQQHRYQAAFAAALLAALAVVLLITGLHAAAVWHSALTQCATSNSWTQSITRRRWLAVRAGWLLLGAAVLAGAVSAIVTWWSGPFNALTADAFQINRFDITDIVPVGYAIFAMALGICAGTLLRRTLPALGITLAGFAGLRAVIALWLRLHYMTPVVAYYKLTAPFTPPGSYLPVTNGFVGPDGKPAALDYNVPNYNGLPLPSACIHATQNSPDPQAVLPCLAAHGYQGSLAYQPASRFWAFQGIETGIFVVLAAVLIGITFLVLSRRDA
jgi:hypothetical protein